MAADESGAAAGPPQVVMVKRELLAACMKCPLCHKLLRDATTITECLHTFCRKCILEKLNDEEVDCCPICNIDLGCTPIEKLRPDHNLQEVRAKIFPFKRRNANAPEVVPPTQLPVRRKERSLSSLVVNTPRIATQTGLTGRRTKAARRAAALRGLGPVINHSIKKEDISAEKQAENSNSTEMLSKMTQNRRQTFSKAEPSNLRPSKDTENGGESLLDKNELWKRLVEAANRTKSPKSSPRGPVMKVEQINGVDNEVQSHKAKGREHLNKSKVHEEKNESIPMPPVMVRTRRLQGNCRKRKELGTSTQMLLDSASAQRERRINQVWFSLVPSFDQEGDSPLPQIPANYLRIKDGNLTVSFIQKYLAKKLNIASEAEVEIKCRGQPVNPILTLHNLVDTWLRGESSQTVQASSGTSGKEFVMVLAYGRRKVSAA
ncbi:E3 ubiquitin protein ligase DRIP2-like isoform X1 [Phoenix dactylifera]|uniref:E3 ubiquitin protein ligase DRIP2-like isoform X1 n=1 Tax=Phoenix dactylifera TaxID=42345 RepID=A0A8B7BYS4_PHODC|nr:E3 ubiquitin protein ligase DRIP2-like isoform X1 [Phoenix dactylifera]